MCYLNSCYLDLIAILTSLVTCFIIAFFFGKIFTPKKESKYYILKYFAFIAGTYVICRLHPFLYEWRVLLMPVSYLISLFVLAKDKWYKKIFITFLIYVFMGFVDGPTSMITFSKYGYTVEEINKMVDEEYFKLFDLLFSDPNVLALNGIYNVILTLFLITLMMILKKETRHFYIWLICVVITGLVTSNCFFSYYYLDKVAVWVLLLCQIIAILLLIYIVQKLSIHFKYDKSLEENKFLKEKEKMQHSYYEMLKSREDVVRKINHDIKNNLQVMYSLDDDEKRKDMIEKINSNLDKHYLKRYTSQEILNVVLNIKVNEALQNKVNLDASIKRKLDFMEDIDVSNLITNILDNAIEAAGKTAEKRIEFVIKKKMNYILIECNNSFNGQVKINKKKQLVSTKSGDHGYGTKIISNIVQKYKGTLEYELIDGNFKVIIMFEV